MNIALPSLARVRGLPGGEDIAAAFMELQAAIVAGWQVSHTPDGQHTTMYSASGVFTALSQPRVRLFKVAGGATTVPTSTDTFVTWDRSRGSATNAEEYDLTGQFNGTDAVLCTAPGLYLVIADVGWDPNGTGYRRTSVSTDRSIGTTASVLNSGDALKGPTQLIVCPIFVPSGTVDNIRIQVFQDSGVNRTVGGWLSVIKLS